METPSEAPAAAQDQPVDASTEAPSPVETSAPVEAEQFSENFDPNTLPDELQPAYKQMHGDYTRKTQALSEQRKEAENAVAFIENLRSEEHRQAALQQLAEDIGPEAVLEALGYTTDDETPDEPVDPGERALQEVEALKAERSAEQAKRTEEQRVASIESHVTAQLAELKVTDEDEQALIVNLALAGLPPGDDGLPRVKEAHAKVNGLWEKRQQAWIESKGAQKASHGQPGVKEFDINDQEARVARMAAIMDAASD